MDIHTAVACRDSGHQRAGYRELPAPPNAPKFYVCDRCGFKRESPEVTAAVSVKAVGSIKGGVMEFRQRGDAVSRVPLPSKTSGEMIELEQRIMNLKEFYKPDPRGSKGVYWMNQGLVEGFQMVLDILRE